MKNNIIIFESNIDLNNLLNNKNIIISGKYLKIKNKVYYLFNKEIHNLFNGWVMNPPFFDNIILLKRNIEVYDLMMLYNMLNMDGNMIINKKYMKTLLLLNKTNGSNIKIDKDNKNEELIISKTNNYLFTFSSTPKYRTIVDFIIMGTQKGGTTSLALNIGQHPDIYIDTNKDPRKSEVHFFDLNWKKGLEWYKKQFDYSKKIVGEKTPDLMYLDYTFPYIQSVNPYVKIILILRNPILRAYSSWKMVTKMFPTNQDTTFEKTIENEMNYDLNENKTFYNSVTHYLQRGLYYKQIKNILKWFKKENLLILISEHVKEHMTETYNEVYSFLNLKPFIGDYHLEFVSGNKTEIDPKLYNKLINFYKKDVESLEKFLKIKTKWFD